MNTLMRRRRALMLAGKTLPPVPSGYITNGLVFFLDGKQLASASRWTDIVGGKVFSLTNCAKIADGIVFDGTGYGVCDGAISQDSQNETIEIAVSNLDTSAITSKAIFSQPVIDGSVGIGLRFGAGNNGTARFAVTQNGNAEPLKRASLTYVNVAKRMGVTSSLIVLDGVDRTIEQASISYGANQSGKTVIGGRMTDGSAVYNIIAGTIHAIRIYSRKLTLAEIQANQATDLTRYNLGG